MLSFKNYLKMLNEGGAIKVGDVSAQPISTKNRKQVSDDVHGMLHGLHDSFHKATGKSLFGDNKEALHSGSALSGSSAHMVNKNISDSEFHKHKPTMGDVDTQVPKEHLSDLHKHLSPGAKFGKYTVVGTKKHGNEVSALMKHDSGEHHQIDFEGTEYHKNEPTKFEKFAHSSSWEDTKSGFKGASHKKLINAVGGEKTKFSITHGLRNRSDDSEVSKDHEGISKHLFGDKADHSKIHSFQGVTDLIKNYIPKEHHQAIYDKMASDKQVPPNVLDHLKKHLSVHVNESSEEVHHTAALPQGGFVPVSHMGHAIDMGGELKKLPGTSKHVGLSGKSTAFSAEERKNIFQRQVGNGIKVHSVNGMGETLAHAHDSLPKTGKKVLHILVGADRKSWGEGIKKSVLAGKVKELEGKHFDEVHVHTPEDENRSHGMSGTNMRQAAHEGNTKEFGRHLGPMFNEKETNGIMKRVQDGIKSGIIPLKR